MTEFESALVGALLAILVLVALFFWLVKPHHDEELQKAAAAKKRALTTQRSVIKGQVAEQIVGLLDVPDLDGIEPSEMRFIGDPIDYVAFRGLKDRSVEEVVLIEIKTGNASLNGTQRQIRNVLSKGRVRFQEVRVTAAAPQRRPL